MLRPCTLRWPAAPALSAPCPLAPPRPRRVVSRPRTETAAMPLDTRRAPRCALRAAPLRPLCTGMVRYPRVSVMSAAPLPRYPRRCPKHRHAALNRLAVV